MKNGISFGNEVQPIDNFLGTKDVKTSAKSETRKHTPIKTFPASKFRRIGAKVIEQQEGFVVDFGRRIVANKIDSDFVKSVLTDSGSDLIDVPDPIWSIEALGNNKFFIKTA